MNTSMNTRKKRSMTRMNGILYLPNPSLKKKEKKRILVKKRE